MARIVYTGSISKPSGFFPDASGEGIVVWLWRDGEDSLEKLQVIEDVDNPTWLALDPTGAKLHATSEVYESADGRIASFSIDPASGALRLVGGYASAGSAACHLAVSADGDEIAWANYGTLPLGTTSDASIVLEQPSVRGLPRQVGVHSGHTVISTGRQDRRHAHCVLFDARRRRLISTDLGLDGLYALPIGMKERCAPERVFEFPPGSGPRHITTNVSSSVFYVVHELSPRIDVLFAQGDGFELVQTLTIGSRDVAQPAGLILANDGRHLLVSIRGTDEVRSFAVGGDGRLNPTPNIKPTGLTPRDLTLSRDGGVLLVACQDAGEIRAYRRDAATGTLSDESVIAHTGSPTCVRIYETNKDIKSWPI